MNSFLRFALATALVTTAAAPAAAGELRLAIADGHVTLVAKDVTVREILAEWARIGQTRIVNGEKLSGGPVTLELNNVPEAQALDTVLRSAAGYVMAPRMAGSPGPSRYDRILILASSRAPVVAASNPAPFTNRPIPQIQPNGPPDDDVELGPTTSPVLMNGPNGPVMGQPGVGPNVMPQPTQPAQPQAPLTAPRPGMLPQPPNAAPTMPPNPYLGQPPGPTAPTFNPMPQPPPTTPRPGGPGGGPGGV